jgi:hypothetical protein
MKGMVSIRYSAVFATSVACLLAARPVLAAEPSASGEVVVKNQGSGEKATVTVDSHGKPVTVARITDRMVAAGVGAGGSVVVAGIAWKDICISPCTFEIDAGLHELMVYGDGVTGATNKFDLRGGPAKLEVKPGSSALSTGGVWVTALGIVGITTGIVFMAIGDDIMAFQALPLTLISGGVTGLGIGMIYGGNTSFERVGSLEATPSRTLGRMPVGIGLHGSL